MPDIEEPSQTPQKLFTAPSNPTEMLCKLSTRHDSSKKFERKEFKLQKDLVYELTHAVNCENILSLPDLPESKSLNYIGDVASKISEVEEDDDDDDEHLWDNQT